MKKIRIITLVLLGMITSAGYSQIQLGVQVGPQFPMGNMDDFNMGIGFSGTAKYFVTEEAAFGLNLGFARFGTEYDDVSASFMPITALFEYNLSSNIFVPYLGFDLGGYNYTYHFEFLGQDYSDSEFHFGFAPTAGLKYDLKDNLYVSGSLKWNYVMTDNDDADWLGLNLGIFIKL